MSSFFYVNGHIVFTLCFQEGSEMGVKNDIDITIGGKTFTLSGVESEEYLREVAAYLNTKIREFSEDSAYWKLPNDLRNVMLQFNLADDFFKEHGKVVTLETQVQNLEEQGSRSAREIEEMRSAALESGARIKSLESDVEELRNQVKKASAAENSASKKFGAEKSRADKLTEELEALRRSKAEADKAVQRLRQELSDTRDSLQGELNRTRTDLEQRLAASESQRKKEVQEIQTLRRKEVDDLQAQRKQEVQDIRSRHQKELEQNAQTSAKTLKEREDSLLRELTDTKDDLTKQLQESKAESAERGAALEKATEEIRKLRSQCDIARLNEENTRKKLNALENEFKDKLAADTLQYREREKQAKQELEKTQDELISLQEEENKRLQAAARVRATMQDLMQQYGRFGQSLEEAAEQMRSLE